MAPKTTIVELTAAEKDELVGGPYGEAFPIPDESEFDDIGLGRLAAYDVEHIARRLMARPELPIGHLNRFQIMFLWAKAGGTSGGKPRWGSVALANPDLKHVTMKDEGQAADAVVRLAADNLREAHATRWQVANELCFLLCRIGLYTTQEGGDERLTLVSPDAAFFTPQMRLFGPQTPELKKTILDIRQTRFDWASSLADDIAKAEAAKHHDPTVDQAAGVEDEIGPEPDGAPAAEWVEPQRFDMDGLYVGPEDHEEDDDAREIRRGQMRANFATETGVDGGEVCKACGLDIDDHDPEVCAGGTPKTRSRKIRQKNQQIRGGAESPSSEGLDVSGDSSVLGHLSDPDAYDAFVERASDHLLGSPNGTNGNHDPADEAGILLDPDRVMATLVERGWRIAYLAHQRDGGGLYVNPDTGEPYGTEAVESEYRSAIAGRRS